MNKNSSSIINPLLLSNCIKLPMYKGHYTTTVNVAIFSNFACIENSLTSMGNAVKNFCGGFKKLN